VRTHARRPKIGHIAASFVGLALLAAPPAHAATNEIYDFNLTESISTYGSYTTTTSSGIQYRWVDSPWKWTSISAASCYTNSPLGNATYSPGQTSYQTIGSAGSGVCFNLRGQTLAGQGSMYYYDGRLSR
jgi:hypothetical protein